MNELINYEAVYRTAPATPGLLKTHTIKSIVRIKHEELKANYFCEKFQKKRKSENFPFLGLCKIPYCLMLQDSLVLNSCSSKPDTS